MAEKDLLEVQVCDGMLYLSSLIKPMTCPVVSPRRRTHE